MRKKRTHVLIILSLLTCIVASAQNIGTDNLGTLKVDELSDQQIENLLKKAEDSGMSQQQLEAAALARGLSASELSKLRSRISALQSKANTESMEDLSRSRETVSAASTKAVFDDFISPDDTELDNQKKKFFGYSIFTNKNLTFEPSLNIATPADYRLGPGDEVIIDIWGASEQNYQLEISPEGLIFINNLGPVSLNGLTFAEANKTLKYRLSAIYSGLKGDEPNTFMQASLGKLRSINVNIIGEVEMPGTYTLQSFATVFNALYYAGGPNINGSLRDIQLIRSGQDLAVIDIYDFLVDGNAQINYTLKDNDIIVVKPYTNRVEVTGEVKMPLIYEVKDKESITDVLQFAGGFNENAYTESVKVERKENGQLSFLDVGKDNFVEQNVINGDKVVVGSIIKKFKNRITIEGAVYRPGDYELTESMNLQQLIDNASGLREDAYKAYASLYRLNDQNKMEIVPVNLNTDVSRIILQPEDYIKIPSIFDLEENFTVRIEGEIHTPGNYPYHPNITIQELIIQAGGVLESASFSRVEVARRLKDNSAIAPGRDISKIFSFQIDQNLKPDIDSAFSLQPYDVVFIRKSPGYFEQQYVTVNGEVAFPGKYAVRDKNETLSDILSRAGGLTNEAYIPGARLTRQLKTDTKRIKTLKALQSESGDTINSEILKEKSEAIGLDLGKVMDAPHSKYDLLVENGDIITIPKTLQTVKVSGSVLFPSTSRYEKGKSARSYVAHAGGFNSNAKKGKVYALYPNGSVDKTDNLLGIHFYPKILPGTEIIVPEKSAKEKMTTQEALALGTAVSSFALVLINIINVF